MFRLHRPCGPGKVSVLKSKLKIHLIATKNWVPFELLSLHLNLVPLFFFHVTSPVPARGWLASCWHTPVFVPAVKTQAPVVLAAFSRPFLMTFFSLGCRSKFALPPCTVMSSLGRSRPHSPVRSCSVWSGRVSWASRIYWQWENICLALLHSALSLLHGIDHLYKAHWGEVNKLLLVKN